VGAGCCGHVRLRGFFGRCGDGDSVQFAAADHQPGRSGKPRGSGSSSHRKLSGHRCTVDVDAGGLYPSQHPESTRVAIVSGLGQSLCAWVEYSYHGDRGVAQTGSAFGTYLTSGFSNGILSGNWFNPASLMPAVTSSFGDIGFLAVAGQAGGGFGSFNPALFSAATAPAALSTVGHIAPAISSMGSTGLVSAEMGRASLVGTMSVPHSWAPAAPTASPAQTASPAEGWYMPPGVEEASAKQGTPGMPGMPMAGGTARGWGFAAPRYGFKPTVVARPPAAG